MPEPRGTVAFTGSNQRSIKFRIQDAEADVFPSTSSVCPTQCIIFRDTPFLNIGSPFHPPSFVITDRHPYYGRFKNLFLNLLTVLLSYTRAENVTCSFYVEYRRGFLLLLCISGQLFWQILYLLSSSLLIILYYFFFTFLHIILFNLLKVFF